MPNKIIKDEAEIQALVEAISLPRLSSYRKFFHTQTDEEALGLYRWNEDVSTAFSRTIAWIEIVLRNRFHAALSQRYGTKGVGRSRDWFAHLVMSAQSRESVQKITHDANGKMRSPAATPDDVVSKLTFGFWSTLMSVRRDAGGVAVPWAQILPEVVPGHRQKEDAYWAAQIHQDALFARLDLCKHMRNRIAHHEPLWKQGELKAEARPRKRRQLVAALPAPRSPQEALERLQLLNHRLTELLHWLSPEVARMVKTGAHHQHCLNLLTPDTLQTYRESQPLHCAVQKRHTLLDQT